MQLINVHLLEKIIKFGTVGVVGMCLDFSVTWFWKEKIRINKYLANTAGFSIAVINNFILNYIWTFSGTTSLISIALGLFIIIAFVGLLLNSILLFVFNDLLSIHFYSSKALAILGVFFWNFTLKYLSIFIPDKTTIDRR